MLSWLLILILGLCLELITVTVRLVLDKKSSTFQSQLKIPRLHHSYLGVLLLVFYFLWRQEWLFMFGAALIFSDFLHHFVVIPILIKEQYDLDMSQHYKIHKLITKHHKSLAVILIILGLLALITPLTPGSWLIPIGLIMLIGRAKAKSILKKAIGWRSKKIIELVPKSFR